jgi:hypothetical protein
MVSVYSGTATHESFYHFSKNIFYFYFNLLLLYYFRDQQEKVAEEMLGLTKRLKEQTLVARTIVQVPSVRTEHRDCRKI